ncbi:DEAD/DEAH box helicase [Haemophilus parainfluenzae]|uniref:DEAD/DEAH box helicase n=1 Tax=Haemophilus parainfluenzae TaxID=729 RepID=UPI0014027D15|nr:DEAD/DEAH box helicase [Haemophilus parainfluenzae]
MKPEKKSYYLLNVTRAKAKMFEYHVPKSDHIKIPEDPTKLLTISIGLLGDFAAAINRGESGNEQLSELKKNLLFSAHFFDFYLQSNLAINLDSYLMLLGAASYYLCDLQGSASVLIKDINRETLDLNGEGLETLLFCLLYSEYDYTDKHLFSDLNNNIIKNILYFYKEASHEHELINSVVKLRNEVYINGTPRQLLLGDLIAAIVKKKLENSAWKNLPLYSGVSKEKWQPILQKNSFIKEFWPAQHLLGKAGILKGKSAVIQMPTSAGKTKSTELIIRSAFLSGRATLAVIVAPFRALCNEIKNTLADAFYNEPIKIDELSDTLQIDFKFSDLLGHQQILVLTPEKLFYILKHSVDLASKIDLLILDEGHQFDSGTRGVTYELLLTSLNLKIPQEAQKILISAVISNAKDIGEWLNGESNVVDGEALIPAFKSIAFASWLDQQGRIEYVNATDIDRNEFFVPRVIEKIELNKKGRERKKRYFPEKGDGQSIAIYLGFKLVSNGSIAIFCGSKPTAVSICEKAIDIIERNTHLKQPKEYSNYQEVIRLRNLHILNLGEDSSASISSQYGIFSHHGNVPHGIRLAVEYAMRENLIRFVVCTSTLAQGVNLPIRYLIVTSIYQAGDRIKVRDFHNLIGRAGRSGMHTEGSILFVDPEVYENRKNSREKWRWEQIKDLLNPNNSEPCISNLLSIFDPITSDDGKSHIDIKALDFAKAYIYGSNDIHNLVDEIVQKYHDKNFSHNGVTQQISWKINLICSLENFLLSFESNEEKLTEANAIVLAEGTLAFYLADEEKKEQLRLLFKILADNIITNMKDSESRIVYGKTFYGIHDSQVILKWLSEYSDKLIVVENNNEIIEALWEIMKIYIRNKSFNKFNKPDILLEMVKKWVSGRSFSEIYQFSKDNDCKLGYGTRPRKIKIENIVDIFEGGIAYDASLFVSTLAEFTNLLERNDKIKLFNILQFFQKHLKYGLPTKTAIALYEMGFADRVIAQDLALSLGLISIEKQKIIEELKKNKEKSQEVMAKYPSYFQNEMQKILNS